MKILPIFLFIALLVSCSKEPNNEVGLLGENQRSLVATTFDAIIKMPTLPHERTRNRELAKMVDTLIASKEFALAEGQIQYLSNWRKQQKQVELATAYFKAGNISKALALVEQVEQLAVKVAGLKAAEPQLSDEELLFLEKYDDFRVDRIKVALSAYYLAMDDKVSSEEWSKNVLPTEQADFIKLKAMALVEEDYDAAIIINDRLATGETFEGKCAAIDGYVALYAYYYEDEAKRAELAEKILLYTKTLPIMYRIEWLHKMAVSAFTFNDIENADLFFTEANTLITTVNLGHRMYFPLKSSNIITAYNIGKEVSASEQAIDLRKEYDEVENSIFDIYRAELLVACAEAFMAVGHEDLLHTAYLDAIDQAGVNPNSRPRVEDLTVIVQSLIHNNVLLSDEIISNLVKLSDSVGEPW
ncbi:MAG: hypothetical protein CBE26_02515 [Kiritimatiellaceae bacterium TMED266]|nr:MAG: hypothetical protein CBE26_02515 [Kiritimatiellaceae bacterium TMED266]